MSKVCTLCKVEKKLIHFSKNKAKKDGLQSRCKDCQAKLTSEWKKSNRERNYAINRKWADKNKDKLRENSKRFYERHRDKELARHAEKRAKRVDSVPTWLNVDQKKEIQEFYWLAKDLTAVSGETYHVDHIVPLQGENVCGLHVPWNLQILPADINLSKGNRYANPA